MSELKETKKIKEMVKVGKELEKEKRDLARESQEFTRALKEGNEAKGKRYGVKLEYGTKKVDQLQKKYNQLT